MRRLIAPIAILMTIVACGQKNPIPEELDRVKETVAKLDSAVTAMYGWEPRDFTYSHSLDTLVAGIMNEYKANDSEYEHQDEGVPAIQQQAYDEARITWAKFKRMIDADKYEEALNLYLCEGNDHIKKKSGDFLVYLKHSTQRYVFFSQVLLPLMQEYKGKDAARENFINNLQLEKAMENVSIQLQADNSGYVPEVYPLVVRDLGIALASSGKMDEAHNLFNDLIEGVYSLSGSALLANYIASDYAEKLYIIEGKTEGAIANWKRFKEAVEQNKSAYDPEEVQVCLHRIEEAINDLSE